MMKLGTAIKQIVAVDSERFRVSLLYTDGYRGTADLAFLFRTPKGKPLVLEILRGDLFARCFVESGALAWPNGYALCPDALRQWITQGKHHAA